eukprot:GILK01008662.1.p1 GENE.GILK01008662.1~~GILK01008662.1.p1  ORF type:complete len:1374 (-),score=250.17 GILK01008662.1:279-4400(-)
MRNLVKLLELSCSPSDFECEGVISTLDSLSNTVYIVSADNVLYGIRIDKASSCAKITLEAPLTASSDAVVALQFIQELNGLCAATKAGDLIIVHVDSQEVEVVGTVNSGITGLCWSPDQELVAVSTGDRTLILFNISWNMLAEVSLNDEPEALDIDPQLKEAPVSISWRGDGQFFASCFAAPGGRKLLIRDREGAVFKSRSKADPPGGVVQSVSERPLPKLESPIAFQHSGAIIAASMKIALDFNSKKKKLIREAADREKEKAERERAEREELLKESEQVKGTAHVIFVEKNGLRHGEFSLGEGPNGRAWNIRELSWNAESDILCVRLLEDGAKETEERVRLYIRNNFHWYLKYEIQPCFAICNVQWHSENPYIIYLIGRQGQIHVLSYTWDYTVSSQTNLSASDPGVVAVVDGAKLLLTPLRKVVIPPPMSACVLPLSAPPLAVAFSNSGKMAVLSSDRSLQLFEQPFVDLNQLAEPPALIGVIHESDLQFPVSSLNHLLWTERFSLKQADPSYLGSVLAVHSSHNSKTDVLVEIVVEKPHDGVLRVRQVFRTNCSEKILRTCLSAHDVFKSSQHLTVSPTVDVNDADDSTFMDREDNATDVNGGSSFVFLELVDGSVLTYSFPLDGRQEGTLRAFTRFPNPCQQIAAAMFQGKEVLVGLTNRSRLYVDMQLMSNECSSFALHDEFLLFINHGGGLSHTLYLLNFNLPIPQPQEAGKPPVFPQPGIHEYTVRAVERGSRVVCAVPNDVKVVTQMPRGNLETVFPRGIMLESLQRLIFNREYKKAFLMSRQHRIDLNLIYDLDPTAFEHHADEVVRQLDQVDYLNLLISSLREEDSTVTLLPAHKQKSTPMQSGKVNRVCAVIRDAIQARPGSSLLLCLLTTYVKSTPPALESALSHIRRLREEESSTVLTPVDATNAARGSKKASGPTAEEALQYVCWMVEADKLYDVALGTYSFELTMMVAQHTQKDPKQYLGYLQELQQMPEYLRRYRIDSDLKRYDRALANLSKAGEEYTDECFTLMSQQNLFQNGLDLYSGQPSKIARIQELWADSLMRKDQSDSAGLLYVACGNFNKAAEAFKMAGNSLEVMSIARRQSLSDSDLIALAYEQAEGAKTAAQYETAAKILLQYCKDGEEAILCFLLGGNWEEAVRIAFDFNRLDLIETNIKPYVLEAYESRMRDTQEQIDNYQKRIQRLEVVQRSKRLMPESTGRGQGDELDDDNRSLASLAMSEYSAYSGVSNASSRSSRASAASRRSKKVAKKKINKVSAREGSPFEEQGIVDLLSKAMPEQHVKDSIQNLLRGLVYFGALDKAQNLQSLFEIYMKMSYIPPKTLAQQQEEAKQASLASSVGVSAAAIKGQATPALDLKWKLAFLH